MIPSKGDAMMPSMLSSQRAVSSIRMILKEERSLSALLIQKYLLT